MKYPRLFSPFKLAGLTLPNRIAMSAMSTHMAAHDGSVTREQIAYYRERALGGAGLIVVEYSCVDGATGLAEPAQLRLDSRHQVASHVPLVETIRDAGARAFLQLHHAGRNTSEATLGGRSTVAPSAVAFPLGSRQVPRPLEDAEIRRLIDCFAQSAQWAVEVGYEGIELHGAHGYLLGQFLSPYTNQRDDEWGGDFERRLAFPAAVIQAVKKVLGPSRPLIYRMSAQEWVPGGLMIEDTERAAPHLARAGADAISVSMGTFDSLEKVVEPMSAEEGWRLPYCGRIRRTAGIPVIASGMVRSPAMAERALADSEGDMITLGRPLLADPDWPDKAREGRDEDIRPCTSCNFCVGRGAIHKATGCAENPRVGREIDPGIPSFGRQRPAVVVGAGPGGMAAALLLDQAGFRVRLYEARGELGGGLIVSATPPHKDKLFGYLAYLRRRIAQSAVEVLLNTRVTAWQLAQEAPAAVVIATGAPAKELGIPGDDRATVGKAYDLLLGDGPVGAGDLQGRRVAVYGGGETGCETAEYLAAYGAQVTLVTRSPAAQLARSAERFYRLALLERLTGNPAIHVRDNASIAAIGERGLTLAGAEAEEVQVDHTFVAQGQTPDPSLPEQLQALGICHAVIGDSVKVRRIGDAVADAYRAVLMLSERMAPTRIAC